MKKTISLLFTAVLILSLCSCGKTEDSGGKLPLLTVETQNYKEDFPGENGEIICSLDMDYPVFESKDIPDIAGKISSAFEYVKAETIERIKANLESTADAKKRFNLTGVTVTKVTFEVYANTPYVVSVSMTEKTGTVPEDDEGVIKGYSFSLADGSKLTHETLASPNAVKLDETLMKIIGQQADRSYSPNGVALGKEQQEKLDKLYSPDNFCCDDTGIAFLYSYRILSSGSREGTYFCKINWSLLRNTLISPREYYERLNPPTA